MFTRLIAMAAVVAVAGMAITADADAKTRWKFGYAYPSSSAGHGDVEKRLTEKLNTLGEGYFEVKSYEPGALVKAMEYWDAISQGSLDCAYSGIAFWTSKEPATALINSYPFGPDAVEFNAWTKYGNGQKLTDKMLDKHNMKAILCGAHSPEASGWFRKEIKTFDDLKGMKMRIFGLGGRTLEKLGVNSQIIAGGDIYAALERGVIDSAEYSMPLMDLSMGFYQIAKHYYFPGWHQQYSVVHMMMNKDKWNALSDKEKMLVKTVCDSETIEFLSWGEAKNGEALDTLKNKHHVQVHRWSDEFLAAFKKSWEEVAGEYIAADPIFKEIWDDQQAFHAKYAYWLSMAKP